MEDEKQELEEKAEKAGSIVPQEDASVDLVYPIEFGEQTITRLTFRPLTAKEMRRGKGKLSTIQDQSTILEYAGFLSGQPTQVIDKLSAPDALEVIEVVAGFFIPSRGTGPKQ